MEKQYYSLDKYLKETFGQKVYKISIDAGFTCPNRDGTKGSRGCIFCSEGGSGELASRVDQQLIQTPNHIKEQIEKGIASYSSKQVGNLFIAYFQAYTNTYGDVETLYQLYSQALKLDMVCGISIATRPDCISDEIIDLLSQLKKQYPQKFIWIELGLQTIHDNTAKYIRRMYPLSVFDHINRKLLEHDIPVIVHVILGLPGETRADMLDTIRYLNTCNIFGIKLQLLHVLKNTDLLIDYENGLFNTLSFDEYISILIDCIEHLAENIVIHRVTGDGPRDLLVSPLWSLKKFNVLNTLHHEMQKTNAYQGKKVSYATGTFHSL